MINNLLSAKVYIVLLFKYIFITSVNYQIIIFPSLKGLSSNSSQSFMSVGLLVFTSLKRSMNRIVFVIWLGKKKYLKYTAKSVLLSTTCMNTYLYSQYLLRNFKILNATKNKLEMTDLSVKNLSY